MLFDSYGISDLKIPDFLLFSIGSSLKLTMEVAYGLIGTLSSEKLLFWIDWESDYA